jgi:hypothetical protein
MSISIFHPPGRIPEREYIYGVLFKEFLGLDFSTSVHDSPDVIIRSSEDPKSALVVPDLLLSVRQSAWLSPESLPKSPLGQYKSPDGTLVPVLYGSTGGDAPPSVADGDLLRLNIDIFGGAFFMLTRYEELVTATRDKFGRFPFSASIAARENFLSIPLVNHYLELLWTSLVQLWPTLKRCHREYRVIVSHDLDLVSVFRLSVREILRSMAADVLLRRRPILALRRLSAYVVGRMTGAPSANDPYDTFDWIMSLSEACGIQSTFNVVPERGDPRLDPKYDIDERWVRALLTRISRRGHEIGFHPGFSTYRDENRTITEFRHLTNTCHELGIVQSSWGGRQHFLRWENPSTWNNLEAAGLGYDSSLQFPEEVGFRCGCCYEYPVFDLIGRRQLQLRERPLLVMDATLLSYMKLSLNTAEDKTRAIIQTVRQFSGDFVLLWHNHFLVNLETQKLYKNLISAATGQKEPCLDSGRMYCEDDLR